MSFPGNHVRRALSMARLLLSLCIVLSACNKSPAQLKVKVGDRFPDLVVQNLKDHPVSLHFAAGKITVLNFWATWCAPCRHEMPSLDRLTELLDDTKFRVVGVSVDDDSHLVREFLLERKIYFENYLDEHMIATNDQIGIRAFPSTFLIGGDGRLLKIVEGWRYWDTLESLNEIKSLASPATRQQTGRGQ